MKKQCNVDVELIFTDKSCFRDESPKVNGYGGDALQLARNGQKMQMRTDGHVGIAFYGELVCPCADCAQQLDAKVSVGRIL